MVQNTNKILIVVGSLDRGGCEMHLARVVPRLKAKGFEVEIFVLVEPGELYDEVIQQGIQVYQPWITYSRGRTWRLLKVSQIIIVAIQLWVHLLRNRPGIVHFFLPQSYIIGAPVSMFAGVRSRIMSRRSLNDYQNSQPRFLAAMERFLHRRMSLVLGNSKRVVQQLVEDEKSPKSHTLLLYNGVDIDGKRQGFDRQVIRKKLDVGEDCLALICVANLIAYKGHADLLNALSLVSAQMPENWRLFLVGNDKGIGDDIKRQAEALGIGQHIVFMGSRSDVMDLFGASDIGILPSHQEGFSNAVLEGMSIGLPMVVTDVGGNAEAVIDNETGVVVSAKDPDGLGQAIVKLAHDPDLRDRMGQAGLERIKIHFDLDDCVDRYAHIYRILLDGGGASSLISDHRLQYASSSEADSDNG